jgi:hypothetical protein
MARNLWCWRCQAEMPMLTDAEAAYVLEPMEEDDWTEFHRLVRETLGSDGLRRIKHQRSLASCDQPIWKALHRLWEAIENAAG